MRKLVFVILAVAAVCAGCTAATDPVAGELEFSEDLAEERRQIGLDAVNQIQLPDGFEIKYTQGTPAEAPSLANQNNPLPASFKYHIDVDTDVPTPEWINSLKTEIQSYGQLEPYERIEIQTYVCSAPTHRMSFRHVETGDLFLVSYNRDRPSELTFYYRYSSGGDGSFGPVDQLFPHPGPACEVP